MGSDLIRMTGMISGMDTESVIKAYTSKTEAKLKKARNSKTLNTWKQDAWKDLNNKIYSFYSKTLSTNRFSGAYKKMKTTTSNSALSVTAGDNAVTGAQTAQIKSAASSAYMTGSKVTGAGQEALKADDTLSKLGITEETTLTLTKGDGTPTSITVSGETTMNDFVKQLKDAGLNANFDESNQRLFISAKSTGADSDFNFSADYTSDAGMTALSKLGLATQKDFEKYAAAHSVTETPEEGDPVTRQMTTSEALAKFDKTASTMASKIDGTNAKLILNGAEFESQTNTFKINGSTYTINHMPSDPNENISVNTDTDYDGVYDVVKGILKEFNSLINEMSKLYNADSAKGYDPLTDEQKEAMGDKEVEEWEKKIKDSLLRNDENLSGVMEALTSVTRDGISVGGKTMYLSDFGISTQEYFSADKNERNALHIDGDPDDDVSAGNTDKLKAMIASDPEAVTSFFQQFASKMYDKLYDKMGSSSLSSIYKVYNDKQLATESSNWDSKILELEDKITAIEDKWYSKFSKMESKLAKMQKNQTAVSGFFG
ncbi:MAG: flagellar filament capping protein FliD [Lachnospiraceae bacterium]|nr:flagellar filament capping protein FliD [Lachnospiraceae bacterium]